MAGCLQFWGTAWGTKIKAPKATNGIAAAAEYGAEFRADLEAFLSREAISACVSRNVLERPRIDGVKYVGFCDPSGGSRDSFCGAVAHREDKELVLDAVREAKAPLSPAATVAEQAQFFKSYGLDSVEGDHYGAGLIRELFANHGISYRPSKANKSELYLTALPLINSASVYLLDNPVLLNQLVLLERLTSRGGKSTVDHPKHGFDDLANAACGAIALAARPERDVMQAQPIGTIPAKIFSGNGWLNGPAPVDVLPPTPLAIPESVLRRAEELRKQQADKPPDLSFLRGKLFGGGVR